MFRATHRSSSGALNFICSLWFTYTCGDQLLSSLSGKWIIHQRVNKWPNSMTYIRWWWWWWWWFPVQTWQRPVTTCVYKPEAANTV